MYKGKLLLLERKWKEGGLESFEDKMEKMSLANKNTLELDEAELGS